MKAESPGAPQAISGNHPCVRSLALGSDFLGRLESLRIVAGRLMASGQIASRAGGVRGGRVEFLDHRGYVEGDDLRDLDWNVYARTNELFTKVFGAERKKHVHIILDLSPSMAAVPGKDLFACRLAAALAHVALAAGDSVCVSGTGSGHESPTLNSVSASREIITMLERLPITGIIDWNREVARFTARPRRPGAFIVISDFWCERAVEAFTGINQQRQEISLLHILTPQELSPPMRGNVRLEDPETGEEISLSLTQQDIDVYCREVQNHVAGLATSARCHGMRHLLCRTDMAFEQAVLGFLRKGGLIG